MAVSTFHYNAIAKGHNNLTGLTNLETIWVLNSYLPLMNDRQWSDGLRSIRGDHSTRHSGTASTIWTAEYISDAQYWYIRTNILAGYVSGPVTIRTHRISVPVTTGMLEMSVIANAELTIPEQRTGNRYDSGDGYQPFNFTFTDIEIIEEEQMYGDIYVTGGSTSQDNIGTTPVKLTAFDTNGLSNGVTPSNSDDSLTVLVAAKYRVYTDIDFTATAPATKWTFTVYKNGAATDIVRTAQIVSSAGYMSFTGIILDLAVNDVLTLYVNSDDGTDVADITVVEGSFGVQSVSIV